MTDKNYSDVLLAEAPHDPRPASLRIEFHTTKQLTDAVKLVALKQGKSMMIDQKKKGSKSMAFGCTDVLAKGATGSCKAFVRATKLQNGLWSVCRKSFNINHMNCNGKPKVTARMLGNSDAIKTAVSGSRYNILAVMLLPPTGNSSSNQISTNGMSMRFQKYTC